MTKNPQLDNTAPIDRVLTRLHKLRQRQSGQWSACCPAHEDGSPSLSVRETPDGAVLMHCFGGCSVAQVCDALGLALHELFPRRASQPFNAGEAQAEPGKFHRDNTPKVPRLLTAPQALALLRTESLFVSACAGSMARGVTLSDSDRQRLMKAATRAAWLHQEACA